MKSVPLSREHGPVEYYYEAVHLTAQSAFPCPKTISQLSVIYQYTVPNLVIFTIYQEPNKEIKTNYFSSIFKYLIIIIAIPKFYILRLINLKISQTFQNMTPPYLPELVLLDLLIFGLVFFFPSLKNQSILEISLEVSLCFSTGMVCEYVRFPSENHCLPKSYFYFKISEYRKFPFFFSEFYKIHYLNGSGSLSLLLEA